MGNPSPTPPRVAKPMSKPRSQPSPQPTSLPSSPPVQSTVPAPNPQPTPLPAPDVQWSCKVEKIGPDGAAAGELTDKITVGEKIYLTCDGPTAHLEKSALSIEIPKQAQYMLRLLDARSIGDTGAQFIATTYMVGDLDFKNPVLTDGKLRIGLGQFSIHSATVIKKEENPEGKPYGPWATQTLNWPAVIWLFIAGICAVIVLLIALALRRSARLKKLRTWLTLNQSALSPFNQFNRDLRMLSKKIPAGRDFRPSESEEYFTELDRAFRFYLTRELDIYAIHAKPGVLLRDLKRVHPDLYRDHQRNLSFVFKEIGELQKISSAKSSTESSAGTGIGAGAGSSVETMAAHSRGAPPRGAESHAKTGSVADAQQLSEKCRGLADLIDQREKEKARGR